MISQSITQLSTSYFLLIMSADRYIAGKYFIFFIFNTLNGDYIEGKLFCSVLRQFFKFFFFANNWKQIIVNVSFRQRIIFEDGKCKCHNEKTCLTVIENLLVRHIPVIYWENTLMSYILIYNLMGRFVSWSN